MAATRFVERILPLRKRQVALLLAALWAGWWVFFGLSSALAEEIGVGAVLLHTTIPGVVFLLCVWVAWRWPRPGSRLLQGVGLLVVIFYPILAAGSIPIAGILFVLLTMALPPLIAGLVLAQDPGG